MAKVGKDIHHAKHLLEQGKLVAIPTETVYGLAANALDATAVTRIFRAKNRPSFDPLIVHVTNFEQAINVTASTNRKAEMLARNFWPGPLTLVLPKKEIIPDIVTSGLSTVGVRCPNHSLTQSLLKNLDFPIAAPSANPFGYVSPTTAEHVNEQLGDHVAYILDGGPCKIGIESTIVGFNESIPTIYRRGGLSQEEIEKVIGAVEVSLTANSNPKSPGQLDSHYAPGTRLILGDIGNLLQGVDPSIVGVLSFSRYFVGLPREKQILLSSTGSMDEAARNLFSALRSLDKLKVDIILAEEVPDEGLGKAINDRLQRAAFKK